MKLISIPASIIFAPSSVWELEYVYQHFFDEPLSLLDDTPSFLRKYRNAIRFDLEWQWLPDLVIEKPWETPSLRRFVHDLDRLTGNLFFYSLQDPAELRLFAACMTDPALVEVKSSEIVCQNVYLSDGKSESLINELESLTGVDSRVAWEPEDQFKLLQQADNFEAIYDLVESRRRLLQALLFFQAFPRRLGQSNVQSLQELDQLLKLLGIRCEKTRKHLNRVYRSSSSDPSVWQLNISATFPLDIRKAFRREKGLPVPRWTNGDQNVF